MSSGQTPLHKVRGLGASHSGTGHFWRERISAVALVLTLGSTIYPALRAAATPPADALRYE